LKYGSTLAHDHAPPVSADHASKSAAWPRTYVMPLMLDVPPSTLPRGQ
jgi:hypothetical protein